MTRSVSTFALAVVISAACGPSQPPPPGPSPTRSTAGIGEPTVIDGETTYVVRGAGYELRSPERRALLFVREEVDDAARSFARYFAQDPPTITVVLQLIEADSTGSSLTSTRPRLVDDKLFLPVAPATGPGRGPTPVAVTGAAVAWVWLVEYVSGRRGEGERVEAEGMPGRIGLPPWFEVAAASVVAGSRRRLDVYVAALAMQPDDLLPLGTLFSATGDSLFTPIPALPSPPPPGRARQRSGPPAQTLRLQGIELFVAQSLAVTHYVAAREGFGSLGRLTDGLLEGQTMEEFLTESRWLPKDIPSLERSWRQWLDDMGRRAR